MVYCTIKITFPNPEKAPEKKGGTQSSLIKSSDTRVQTHFVVLLNFRKEPPKSHPIELQPSALSFWLLIAQIRLPAFPPALVAIDVFF